MQLICMCPSNVPFFKYLKRRLALLGPDLIPRVATLVSKEGAPPKSAKLPDASGDAHTGSLQGAAPKQGGQKGHKGPKQRKNTKR